MTVLWGISCAFGAISIALLARRLRALSLSGAVAAAVVGFLHAGFAREIGISALLTFFCTSTLLSRLGKRKKATLHFEKGGERDAAQVLANGGIAALCALFFFWYPLMLYAMLGALASANADTWATEIGSLWGGTPRRITTLKPAQTGESGAISLPGTLAALLGALLIGPRRPLFWTLSKSSICHHPRRFSRRTFGLATGGNRTSAVRRPGDAKAY